MSENMNFILLPEIRYMQRIELQYCQMFIIVFADMQKILFRQKIIKASHWIQAS